MREARFSDIEIEIEIPGGIMRGYQAGPTDWPLELAFLHAAGLNARSYRHMLAPLGERARVAAFDLRGHGRTGLALDPERLRNFHAYKNDVIAALDSLDGPPLAIAGHSLGATVALLLAAERPDLVRAVVAFDPPVLPPVIAALTQNRLLQTLFADLVPPYRATRRRRTWFESRAAAVEAYRDKAMFRNWPRQALEDYVADGFVDARDGGVTLACPREWEARTYLAHKHDVLGAARRLEAPLTVILAERGSPTPATVEWRLRRLSPGVAVTRLQGRGHMFPIEEPAIARAALSAALDA